MIIDRCNFADERELHRVHQLQVAAYTIEAELIGCWSIPALHESLDDLAHSRETFWGCFLSSQPGSPRDVVGIIATEPEPHAPGTIRISRLAIDPTHTRRGFGRALVSHVLSSSRDSADGHTRVIVSTGAANTPACRLYESMGFQFSRHFQTPDGLVQLAEYVLSQAIASPAAEPPAHSTPPGSRHRPMDHAMTTPTCSLRRVYTLDTSQIEDLCDVLIDCVEGGASISFMLPFTRDRARAFWQSVADGVAAGKRALFIAEDSRGICGTVQLLLDLPENQPHRADLVKMLVHRRARRQGLGAALMRGAEVAARESGRTLLVLDAVTDGDASRLYERLGWVRVGDIPNFALYPDGRPVGTTYYYRDLSPR